MIKILLIILMIILLPVMVFASPFLTCDPQDGVTKYRVNIPSAGIINEISNAASNGAASHDIGVWPAGTYNDGTLEAGGEYILNGESQGIWRWSQPTPFGITVPSLNPTVNLGLSELPLM